MSKRPKHADELTRTELEEIKAGADVPLVDDDATLEAAGINPETREPFETPEAEDKRIRREEEIAEREAMTVEDWAAKIREDHEGKTGGL